MIDSHAHLFDEQFSGDLAEVIFRAKSGGIEKIIIPATNIETSKKAIKLNQNYDFIFPAVGIHPHEVANVNDDDLKIISELADNKNVIAIGEIGLDYFYDFAPKEKQIEIFKKQIDIAVTKNLPIIIHTRDSMNEAISIVEEKIKQFPNWREKGKRGVFHCFGGSTDEANKIFSLGFLISITGMVTFKNTPVIETLKNIGIKNIMLETDSPYLAPVPHRGKRNEPIYIFETAKKICEICNCSLEELRETTNLNCERLFGKQ